MRRRGRSLKDHEKALWDKVAKSVTPLSGASHKAIAAADRADADNVARAVASGGPGAPGAPGPAAPGDGVASAGQNGAAPEAASAAGKAAGAPGAAAQRPDGAEPIAGPPSAAPAPKPAPAPPFLPPYVPPQSRPARHGLGDLDRGTRRKLARGATAIEARIDLHGMTQEVAHRALSRFILDSHQKGLRLVLVITGKGLGPGEDRGVLRRSVPHWLNQKELRALIVGTGAAHQVHGGDGALYVRLRGAKAKR